MFINFNYNSEKDSKSSLKVEIDSFFMSKFDSINHCFKMSSKKLNWNPVRYKEST